MPKKLLSYFSPSRTILFSVLSLISIGVAALALPGICNTPLSLIDIIFTATSAISATCLFPIPFEQFTFFGQAIIVTLMQVGSIGLITISLFLISLFVDIGFSTQLAAGQLLNISPWNNVKKNLLFVIILTLSAELIGATYMAYKLSTTLPPSTACWMATVQAISAFCNGGLTLLPITTNAHSMIALPTSILVFIGGFGFITWYELLRYIINKINRHKHTFSLHSKVTISTSATLLIVTTILFWALEKNNLLTHLSTSKSLMHALFYAINFKSAGFLLTDINNIHPPTILLMLSIAFIGSSPGSMGSGIKITTFAVFLATIKATIKNKNSVVINERTISVRQIHKATAIITLSLVWILITSFFLLITQSTIPFKNLLFETISAFTNLGISIGITPQLSNIGKVFIIMSMLMGKIGTISFILAVKSRQKMYGHQITYPHEQILLG